MERKEIKGPDTPRPPHWMGDEPMQTVGDPFVEQGTLPHYGTGGSVGFWQVEHPIHPGTFPIIEPPPGREIGERDRSDAEMREL